MLPLRPLTTVPVSAPRYLLTLIAVTFFAAFRSVVLHPLNYGVGLIMAPLAWIATAVSQIPTVIPCPLPGFHTPLVLPLLLCFSSSASQKYVKTLPPPPSRLL